jgi:uncharacterized SAM-binding protein YcdF (DUF218 family)
MTADDYSKILWDYLKLNQKLERCEGIIVLGSHDNDPARYAVELLQKDLADYIIFSGGVLQTDPHTYGKISKTEAENYMDIALNLGAPKEKLFLENKATNTAENLKFSIRLAQENGLETKSFILVHKPYNERRLVALVEKQFPGPKFIVTSEPTTFEKYTNRGIPKTYIYENIVGEMQRLKSYGENGFQMPVEIPAKVWKAYEKLVEMGYTRRLVK